jgi:hypothetical protein
MRWKEKKKEKRWEGKSKKGAVQQADGQTRLFYHYRPVLY